VEIRLCDISKGTEIPRSPSVQLVIWRSSTGLIEKHPERLNYFDGPTEGGEGVEDGRDADGLTIDESEYELEDLSVEDSDDDSLDSM